MQITIDKLLPMLRRGYVAMHRDKEWYWYGAQPRISGLHNGRWCSQSARLGQNLSSIFNIVPFKGSWKDSVMKCGHTATVKDGE